MRGKKAKRIRKEAYGNESIKTTTYSGGNGLPGQPPRICLGSRALYQDLKNNSKNGLE